MDNGPPATFPRTVNEIYDDYSRRRGALLRALTDEVDDFWQQCDPERDNLCLYGHRDATWTVDLPAEEVPPELPEPCLGINFARDGMAKRDWLALVAVHSDAWLMAVASFFSVKLDAAGRMRLFRSINSHATLFEIVSSRNRPRALAGGAGGGMAAPAPKRRKDSGDPSPPEFDRPSEAQYPSGRKLKAEDLTTALKGCQAELFWPDNNLWYLVEIMDVKMRTKTAKIVYATGEEEELNLEEIINEGHMCLL